MRNILFFVSSTFYLFLFTFSFTIEHMDPRLQTSFIPKNPLVEGGRRQSNMSPRMSYFFMSSVVVFVVTLLIFCFFFGYNVYLKKSIASMDEQLRKDMDFPANTINELARLDLRINTSSEILKNHIAASSIFKLFESITAKNTQFSKLQYVNDTMGIKVTASGRSASFNSLVFQSDLVRNHRSVKNPIFSDIHLDDFGNVLFELDSSVDKDLLLYANNFGTTTTQQ